MTSVTICMLMAVLVIVATVHIITDSDTFPGLDKVSIEAASLVLPQQAALAEQQQCRDLL